MLPPLIGYLIAGIIISPNTPGIEADIHLANQLAELGVMFLMRQYQVRLQQRSVKLRQARQYDELVISLLMKSASLHQTSGT
jgi:predicted Kef-type K+ transport protein